MIAFDLILGAALFCIVLYWDIQTDYKKWLEGKPIKHFKEGLIRAFMLLPSILLYSISSIKGVVIWQYLVLAAAMFGSLWWYFFDGLLNRKRNKDWYYNGSKDPKNDSFLDNILRNMSRKQQALLKKGLITLTTIGYITVRIIFG